MIKEVIDQWDANKSHLESIIAGTDMRDISYEWLMGRILTEVLNRGDGGLDFYEEVFMAECGDCQGSDVFVFYKFNYCRAYNIYVTFINYGSCSKCDTLEKIRQYNNGLPDKEQVKMFMTLCLHMVQRIKPLYSKEEDNGFDYTNEDIWI